MSSSRQVYPQFCSEFHASKYPGNQINHIVFVNHYRFDPGEEQQNEMAFSASEITFNYIIQNIHVFQYECKRWEN